jgi:hypothetical protein
MLLLDVIKGLIAVAYRKQPRNEGDTKPGDRRNPIGTDRKIPERSREAKTGNNSWMDGVGFCAPALGGVLPETEKNIVS